MVDAQFDCGYHPVSRVGTQSDGGYALVSRGSPWHKLILVMVAKFKHKNCCKASTAKIKIGKTGQLTHK